MGECEEEGQNSGYVISACGWRTGVLCVWKARQEVPGVWKDQVNRAEGIGIGTGKAHTTDARMASGHDGLASEGVRT